MKRPISMWRTADDWIVLSGQTGQNPDNRDDVAAQTEACLRGLERELAQSGVGLGALVKVNVYLADIDDYDRMNEVYGALVPEPYPARTCIGVAALPGRALVEIEGWARRAGVASGGGAA